MLVYIYVCVCVVCVCVCVWLCTVNVNNLGDITKKYKKEVCIQKNIVIRMGNVLWEDHSLGYVPNNMEYVIGLILFTIR